MDTNEKSSHRSLDQRIADALNGEIITSASLSDLIIEVEDAVPISTKALEAEKVRLVDPSNRDPERTKQTVDKIELELQRLNAAIPMLEARYHKAQHHERRQNLLPRYNEIVDDYNEKSVALVKTYNAFCQQFVPMLEAAFRLNDAIRKINAQASGLLTTIPTIAEGLLEGLKLPSQSGGFLWPDPRLANLVAAQWAEQMAQAYASPLRQSAYSADWHEAKKMDDERKLAEWARRNEQLEREKEAAKREYVEAQHRAARGERD